MRMENAEWLFGLRLVGDAVLLVGAHRRVLGWSSSSWGGTAAVLHGAPIPTEDES
jgi:hypothetical protein